MAELILHKDLTPEQIDHIERDILAIARTKQFFGQFTKRVKLPRGHKTIRWRRFNITNPKLADIKALEEGHTPNPEAITYSDYVASVNSYGSWAGYTDEDVAYNYDNIVDNLETALGRKMAKTMELKRGEQFYKGTATITAATGTDALKDTFLKAKTVLQKNEIEPWSNGLYIAIVPPEVQNSLLSTYYKTDFITNSERQATIKGYIGEAWGFMVLTTSLECAYKDASNAYLLFMGIGANGVPVQEIEAGEGNATPQIIHKELGTITETLYDSDGTTVIGARSDALNQRGAVGVKMMGWGARIVDDFALLRCEYAITQIAGTALEDSGRSHYNSAATSPVPEDEGE